MPPRQLPARPNLEQLKKQAKSLLACGAGARRGRAPSLRRAARRSRASPSIDIGARSGAARRAVGDRARTRIPVLERAARRSRSAHAVVRRQPSTNSSAARPAARPAARTGCSRSIRDRVGHAADGAGSRRCRVGGSAAARASGARDRSRADRRTGSRCSTCATRACISTCLPAWRDLSRSRGGSARSARIRTRSTTGTGTRSFRGRRCGAPSARSGICRSPKCCSRPARIRPTASRCTSPAAAATSTRSNCCTATAST